MHLAALYFLLQNAMQHRLNWVIMKPYFRILIISSLLKETAKMLKMYAMPVPHQTHAVKNKIQVNTAENESLYSLFYSLNI